MSLAGWYVSFIVHVFPVTVQEIVQHPLLTHVKDSVDTVPISTPLVSARDSHVFLDAPYMDSSLQIQPSFSLATIRLVFLGSICFLPLMGSLVHTNSTSRQRNAVYYWGRRRHIIFNQQSE